MQLLDPYKLVHDVLGNRFLAALRYRSGYRFLHNRVAIAVLPELEAAAAYGVDLIWVDGGDI